MYKRNIKVQKSEWWRHLWSATRTNIDKDSQKRKKDGYTVKANGGTICGAKKELTQIRTANNRKRIKLYGKGSEVPSVEC